VVASRAVPTTPVALHLAVCSDPFVFVRVWLYEVRPDRRAEFVAGYRRDGDWARLFASHAGFESTELYAGAENPDRFLTVDRWRDQRSWVEFRADHAAEYDALDRRFEGLTVSEQELFAGPAPLSGPPPP
jgi:heme-degrading monooxygenase HmoA